MQMKMEASILSQVRRLPGLPSSHVGLDTLLGRDTTIDFEDYLGDPRVSERAVDARAILEQRYGVAPRGAAAPSFGLAAAAGLPREGVAMRKELSYRVRSRGAPSIRTCTPRRARACAACGCAFACDSG